MVYLKTVFKIQLSLSFPGSSHKMLPSQVNVKTPRILSDQTQGVEKLNNFFNRIYDSLNLTAKFSSNHNILRKT